MREIVLKNLVSANKRKREVCISESMDESGMTQKMEKRTIYVVKEVLEITSDFDLQLFLLQRTKEGKLKPKQTFVTRVSSQDQAEEKFYYKVYGDTYTIVDDKIFLITLIQLLTIEFSASLT
ncbi:hypothetical protein ACFL38_01225 [Candidatus Omnitrophota bacterium]